MKALDRKLLRRFLSLAGERLKGDWVLIGGTVLPAMGVDHRVTVDIDLISLGTPDQGQTLELMKIAEELGLPVETINQAGAHFLAKMKYSRKELALLKAGTSARIYRPGTTLYLLLKIQRLNESDLQDCLQWLRLAKKLKEAADLERIRQAISVELVSAPVPERRARLERLLAALG